jgi:hypothetical protein
MVITYEIYTQHIGNAREIALRRAASEGWSRATVLAVHPVDFNTYEVTVTVFR